MKGALGKERGTMLMAMTEDDGGEAMHLVFRKEGPEVTGHVQRVGYLKGRVTATGLCHKLADELFVHHYLVAVSVKMALCQFHSFAYHDA